MSPLPDNFRRFAESNKLFRPGHHLLLAVSGGVDSTVLAHLCQAAGYRFSIAHCNFTLRGRESDKDEKFVEGLARKFRVKFFSKRFDTLAFASEKKISIQMAARDLRYSWFEEISQSAGCDRIVLAHQKDDVSETMLINLIRGTGISGLSGIPIRRGNFIRPLLFASREEIAGYAGENNLKFREDSSNQSDDYVRNKIRHAVMPLLKEINPSISSALSDTARHLADVNRVYAKLVSQQLKGLWKDNCLTVSALLKLDPLPVYLYELLKPYGYNASQCSAIFSVLKKKETGQQFFSATHRIVKDRNRLMLSSLNELSKQEANAHTEYFVAGGQKSLKAPFAMNVRKIPRKAFVVPASASMACLDEDKLKFPLGLRRWKPGDYFYPLGMKTRKKLSDYFTDNKFSVSDKENTWLLTSDGDIVWIVGRRIDERFKVSEKTKVIRIFKL